MGILSAVFRLRPNLARVTTPDRRDRTRSIFYQKRHVLALAARHIPTTNNQMRTVTKLPLYLVFSGLAATLSAQQAAPKLMHYQGKLTNSSGAALGDGQYTLRFELFDAATAGQRIWGESRANVPLSGGLFSVVLGAAGSEPVTPSAVNDLGFAFGGADRYLQTTLVSGPGITTERTLLPRQQLASVPFALQSQKAQNAVSADLLGGKSPAFYSPTGSVSAFVGTSDPPGWLICDGRTLNQTQFPDLYALIQTTYGTGDGTNGSFNLPDYRGMFLRGAASIPPVTITAVDTALETVTVTSHPYRRNGIPVRLTGSVPGGLAQNTTYYTIVVDANKLAFATTEANAIAASPTRINIASSGFGTVVQALDPDNSARRAPIGNNLLTGVGSFQLDQFLAHRHEIPLYITPIVSGAGGALGPRTTSGSGQSFGTDNDLGFRSFTDAGTTPDGGNNINVNQPPGGNETRPINVYVNYIIKY